MPPKHFDPAQSYSSDEGTFICQIYEPVIQYHFLKRPYELEPLTAIGVPEPTYAEKGDPFRAVYEIKLKKAIMYQPHPCFAKDQKGDFIYHNLSEKDVGNFLQISDFAQTGTRELKAADYVLQIKRLADPRLNCPILSTMSKYILGLQQYNAGLQQMLQQERQRRKKQQGFLYNRADDEKENPIILNYDSIAFPGVELVDDYTFRVILKKKYPQIKYWLAMSFFVPVPEEALAFYAQPVLIERNITLDRFPVGTGPYYIETYLPNKEIILAKNPYYHLDFYPSEGDINDTAHTLLNDAGKRLPFIDKAVYIQEKESITSWNKFLQGYYDTSGIASDSFDQAIQMTDSGVDLTDSLQEKGIGLVTAITASIWYFGFNMHDSVVGGYDDKKCKLRRAISIAINIEERIDIFNNGRGIPAHSIIPPGIFGYLEGRPGMNPYLYTWHPAYNMPIRKSIPEAKKLLAEAGYPNGIGPDGRQLVISFDNMLTGSSNAPYINWLIKQFQKLNIHLKINSTDYNRFRDKISSGNFQFFSWGWNADYPDPENFMFLLYGPNSRIHNQGENTANYDNPEYNRLFLKMENMENTSARQEIINKMTRIIQHDAPLYFGFFNESYSLYHNWYKNVKPNLMGRNNLKYKRIDSKLRSQKRMSWNRPIFWPIVAALVIMVICAVPAAVSIWRKQKSLPLKRDL
jgi:ABC-type oligopeptide transport system substrate-binding subunit